MTFSKPRHRAGFSFNVRYRPKAARAFMLRGAEVVLHPTSDSGAIDLWAWESAKRVRAAENML